MKKIAVGLFVLMLIGYLYLGGKWIVNRTIETYVNIPGERSAVKMQSYASPDRRFVATVRFKLLRSDDHIDNYNTWVELGPITEERGTSVITVFRSSCISCEWTGTDALTIFYFGEINTDHKILADAHGVKISLVRLNDPNGHNPSKMR